MSDMTDPNTAEPPLTAEAPPAEAAATERPSLEAQLEEVRRQAEEHLSGWKRALAEFDNYRKRAEKEREEIYQNAAVETLRRLLPIIDDFERAIAALPPEKTEDETLKGFLLIHRKLISLLEGAGLTQLDPKGQAFDPTRHEAIGQDPNTEVASGHISTVLQKGYLHGERVIRPALVRVAE